MISYWWMLLPTALSFLACLYVLADSHLALFERVSVSLLCSIFACIVSGAPIAGYNENVRMHNMQIQQFAEIQKEWRIIEVFEENSKTDPAQNSYIVEKVDQGVTLRGKILSKSRLEVVDVKVVSKELEKR